MVILPPSPGTEEPELVDEYQHLTGATEAQARGVFMLVCCGRKDENGGVNGESFLKPKRISGLDHRFPIKPDD